MSIQCIAIQRDAQGQSKMSSKLSYDAVEMDIIVYVSKHNPVKSFKIVSHLGEVTFSNDELMSMAEKGKAK